MPPQTIIDTPVQTAVGRVLAVDADRCFFADGDQPGIAFGIDGDGDRLGVVNLRADIELKEIETERGTLAKEREDVLEAIRKLREEHSQPK